MRGHLHLHAPAALAPEDFGRHEDLPVGQVVRRFGERRLGLAQDTNDLTENQERLARHMELRALSVGARPMALLGREMSRAQRPQRHPAQPLALKVDTAFGRFHALQGQTLFPTGRRGQIDATYLRLWIDKEIEAVEAEWTSLRADLLQRFQDARPAELASTLDLGLAAASQAIEQQRQRLREAMIQAVQGDTAALARLTHGEQALQIAARLQARALEEAQRQPAPLAAAAGDLTAPRFAAAQALDAALAAPITLSPEALELLRAEVPALSVDAASTAFSFEGAAQQILQRARQLAARAARQPEDAAPLRATPGDGAARAARFAQRQELTRARIFGASALERRAQEAIARAMTPFADTAAQPDAPALRLAPAPGAPALLDALRAGRPIAAAEAPLAALAPRRPLGEHALRAMTPRAALATEGSPARAWLMDGGRGVLLDGLDGAGPRRPQAAPPESPWARWSPAAAQEPALVAARAAQDARALAAAVAALQPRNDLAPLWGAPLTHTPAEAARHALAAQSAPALLQMAQERAPLAAGNDALPRAARMALEPLRALEAAAWIGPELYDAATHRDLSGAIAQAATAALVQRIQDRHRAAEDAAQALPAITQALGEPLSRAATQAALQDVQISARYLPALVGSLSQIERSARHLQRFASDPDGEAPLAQADAVTLRQAAQALGREVNPERLSARAAALAERFAEIIRAGQPAARAQQQRPGYQRRAQLTDLTPIQMEARLAAPRVEGASDERLWRLTAALAQATEQAQTSVASLAAITAAAAREPAATPATITTSGRALQLFSPEKTLALLAPQLESGAILDPNSRRELSAALEALSQSHAATTSPRRVQTPFGTLSLRLDQGQLIVQTEETTSLASPVILSQSPSQSAQTTGLTTWAAAQTAGLSLLQTTGLSPAQAPQVSQAERLARRLEAVASPAVVQRLAQLGDAGFEVLLGASSRAERGAGVSLDDAPRGSALTSASLDAVARRLGVPAASAAQALLEALSPERPARRAALHHGSAGEMVRVHAGGDRAAQIISALQQSGFALPSDAQARVAQALAAPVAAQDKAAPPLLGALQRLDAAQLTSLGRFLDLAPDAASLPLERLLHEAAQARAIGALGRVGMGRHALAGFSQADMAWALPFLQRAPEGAAARQGELARGAAWRADATSAGAPDAAALVAQTLGLGGAADLGALALRMGLPAAALREDAAGLSLQAQVAALGAASRAPRAPEEVARANTTYGRWGGALAPEAALLTPEPEAAQAALRQQLQQEQGRLARVSQRLQMTQQRWDEERGASSRPGGLRPQALSGVILRDLGAVGEVLEALGGPRREALGASARASLQGAAARLQQRIAGGPGEFLRSGELPGVGESFGASEGFGEGRSGRVGVWLPAGVERLVSESTDSLLQARGGFEGTHIAPSLLRAPTGGGARGLRHTRAHGVREGSLRAAGRGLALGLQAMRPGAGPAGELLAVGVAADALQQGQWMSQTQNQQRVSALLESLGMAAASASPGVMVGAPGVRVPGAPPVPELLRSSPPAPTPQAAMLQPGQWSRPGTRDGYQAVPAPSRELFRPFVPPEPARPSGASANAVDGRPWAEGFGGQGVSPRASMGDNRQEESRAERTERHTSEKQAEAPNREQIEDMARDVLDVLKQRWMVELERRGTE